MVVPQPFKELDRLVHLLARTRRIGLGDMLDRLVHLGAHVVPVLDRVAHVGQGLADPGLERLAHLRRERVEMNLDHGFGNAAAAAIHARAVLVAAHLDHRVEHGQHVQPVAGDLAHDGVHQEGPVPPHDLKHVAAQIPAVGAFPGPDAHLHLALGAACAPSPELGRQPDRVVKLQRGHVFGQRVAPDLQDETFRIRADTAEILLEALAGGGEKGVTIKGVRDADDGVHAGLPAGLSCGPIDHARF